MCVFVQHDIVLKVTATAICGSDLHLYEGAMLRMQKGDVLGHEFMGIVEQVGPDVKSVKKGDRVVTAFDIGTPQSADLSAKACPCFSASGSHPGHIMHYVMRYCLHPKTMCQTISCRAVRHQILPRVSLQHILHHIRQLPGASHLDPSSAASCGVLLVCLTAAPRRQTMYQGADAVLARLSIPEPDLISI